MSSNPRVSHCPAQPNMLPAHRVTEEDVVRAMRRDFSDDVDAVWKQLRAHGTESWQRETDHVRLAILKLRRGYAAQVIDPTDAPNRTSLR